MSPSFLRGGGEVFILSTLCLVVAGGRERGERERETRIRYLPIQWSMRVWVISRASNRGTHRGP